MKHSRFAATMLDENRSTSVDELHRLVEGLKGTLAEMDGLLSRLEKRVHNMLELAPPSAQQEPSQDGDTNR